MPVFHSAVLLLCVSSGNGTYSGDERKPAELRSCPPYHIPFLCAIIMKKNNSVEFRKLWADNRFNRGLLVSMIVIKVLICIIIVMGIIIRLFNVALGSGLILSFLIIVVIYFSKRIRKRSLSMEKQFLENFQGTAGTFPQEEPETGETSTEKIMNYQISKMLWNIQVIM